MSLNNIEDLGNTLVIAILEFQEPLLMYLALRLAHVNHQRLFIKYTSNKCTIQPVGIFLGRCLQILQNF
ncbi:hypothetical protein NQ317_003948 [Molorchus minor]|uniref:Uncharacterized protein n=1 Tax=Molorchus minor TaxID=1323400 RepID=A0ABQ9JDX9_9CUCU|nr:hypothetical protein NQ317_003948 [Molorchus minor]